MAVLERHVDVRHQALLLPHQLQQLLVESRRIGVEEADPLETGRRQQRLRQPRESMLAVVQILAVARRVLGDQAELADALRPRARRASFDQARDRPAAEASAPERNRAEGARVVAAFGDLEVGIAARRQHARRGVIEDHVGGRRRRRRAAEIDDRLDLEQRVERDEAVDLGNVARQLLAEAVHHAAGDQELADPLALARRHLEDGVDRLALGLVDEGAGVDDHRLGALHVGGDRVPAAGQLAEQDLAVDAVLGAAETDQTDAGGGLGTCHSRASLANERRCPGRARLGARRRAGMARRRRRRGLSARVAGSATRSAPCGAGSRSPAARAGRGGSCRTRSAGAAAPSGSRPGRPHR